MSQTNTASTRARKPLSVCMPTLRFKRAYMAGLKARKGVLRDSMELKVATSDPAPKPNLVDASWRLERPVEIFEDWEADLQPEDCPPISTTDEPSLLGVSPWSSSTFEPTPARPYPWVQPKSVELPALPPVPPTPLRAYQSDGCVVEALKPVARALREQEHAKVEDLERRAELADARYYRAQDELDELRTWYRIEVNEMADQLRALRAERDDYSGNLANLKASVSAALGVAKGYVETGMEIVSDPITLVPFEEDPLLLFHQTGPRKGTFRGAHMVSRTTFESLRRGDDGKVKCPFLNVPLDETRTKRARVVGVADAAKVLQQAASTLEGLGMLLEN